MTGTPEQEICFLEATELARRIRAKELSAAEVMRAHLARIERVNPRVNAIVTLLPERAMDRARAADEALAERRSDRCTGCRWRIRTCSRRRACAPPSVLWSIKTSSRTWTP